MERMVGTVSMGIRTPIIRQGDDLSKIVTECIVQAVKNGEIVPRDRDIVCMTEAIVARAQGNYATVEQIAADVRAKLGGETVGVIFPILSRNRFSVCLRGIAMGCKKVVLMLSYPADEVGNHLIDLDTLDEKGINPYTDVLTERQWRELFGYPKHTFTGIDYIEFYKDLIQQCGAEAEVIFANDCRAILPYTKNVLCCDIHTRQRTKRLLRAAGGEKIFGLDDILTESIDGSGKNARYGLLGSNKATETTVKLFPDETSQALVEDLQQKLLQATGKHMEVMVYGDGALCLVGGFACLYLRFGGYAQRTEAQIYGRQRVFPSFRRGTERRYSGEDRAKRWLFSGGQYGCPGYNTPAADRSDRLAV